jgi:hypothetical protein
VSPIPLERPPPRKAGPDLLVLQKWEDFCAWLLQHTGRWPKHARFTFAQRVENHALDIAELLVIAKYERAQRRDALYRVNLKLERLRHLFRLAKAAGVMPNRGFESALRGVDEAGRMVHGWRERLKGRRPKPPEPET